MDGKITYSRRKSFSLRIAPDGSLDIRAPIGMPRREIDRFLEEKADWIATHRAQVLRDRQQGALHAIGAEQLETLKELAREPIYESLRRFAPQMGVNYGRVTIRCQKSRWGSCSSSRAGESSTPMRLRSEGEIPPVSPNRHRALGVSARMLSDSAREAESA